MELGKKVQTAVLLAAVLIGGMALAGCNDDVEVLRDPDVKVSQRDDLGMATHGAARSGCYAESRWQAGGFARRDCAAA